MGNETNLLARIVRSVFLADQSAISPQHYHCRSQNCWPCLKDRWRFIYSMMLLPIFSIICIAIFIIAIYVRNHLIGEDTELSSDQELRNAEAHANAMFAGIQLYREYMQRCEPMIMAVLPRADLQHRDDAIRSVWIRAYGWMQSLELLNHTKHIQAISAGNRALLEFTVDLVLLHTDPTNNSGWKMYHLAFSERLKAAEQLASGC